MSELHEGEQSEGRGASKRPVQMHILVTIYSPAGKIESRSEIKASKKTTLLNDDYSNVKQQQDNDGLKRARGKKDLNTSTES